MAVSPPPAPSSIDLSGLPPRVVEAAARVLALCREELRSEPRPEAPEEVELRVREATNEFARDVMGAVIENRDDGASRIERDGQSWFRVAVTPKTIMTSLGPVTYRRARYRSGASGASPVPVDESLGLVDDYLTRPAAELGLLMMGHCTAREAAAFFAKTGAMTPSVSTLQRLTLSMHECWESLGPETLGSIREAEGIPQDATTASVSLDGVMVPLRPGEDGRAKASWREAACGSWWRGLRSPWTQTISPIWKNPTARWRTCLALGLLKGRADWLGLAQPVDAIGRQIDIRIAPCHEVMPTWPPPAAT